MIENCHKLIMTFLRNRVLNKCAEFLIRHVFSEMEIFLAKESSGETFLRGASRMSLDFNVLTRVCLP